MTRNVTFGELAIGDVFWWRDTAEIKSGPRGHEPMRKASATRYEWSRGYGTAEPHYPVQRIRHTDLKHQR
jgi:hypothetical protein